MPERVYLCDGEFVCEYCAEGVDDSDSVAPGSETDIPQHCAYCHCPLFTFSFTPACVQYVYRSVREQLKAGTADNGWRWGSGYYEGMGKEAVLREWAAHEIGRASCRERV